MSTLGQGDQGVLDLTFQASAVMASAYVAVKLDTTAQGYVALAGDGEKAFGILQTTAAAVGDSVRVRVWGTSLVLAGADFSIDALLNSGAATGKLDDAASGEYFIAKAIEASTAGTTGDAEQVLALVGHGLVA